MLYDISHEVSVLLPKFVRYTSGVIAPSQLEPFGDSMEVIPQSRSVTAKHPRDSKMVARSAKSVARIRSFCPWVNMSRHDSAV